MYSQSLLRERVKNKIITSCAQNNANNAYYVNAGVNNNNKNNNNGVLVCYERLKMAEYISLEEVEAAYFECRKNKRNSCGALEYELNYEINNYQLWKDLNNGSYSMGVSICFCVTRPKLREVFAADFRDRIVHHLIMRKFLRLFDSRMIDNSYNCRKGKGTLCAVRNLQHHIEIASKNYTRKAYVLKCDLQGFFMSIDRDILWRLVLGMIRENYHGNDTDFWLNLIHMVIYNCPEKKCERHGDLSLWDDLEPHKSLFHSNGKGLPIGNLTSQVFANLYLTVFDVWVLSQISDGEFYDRFMDDYVIISQDKKKLISILQHSRTFLREVLHVSLHPRKVYLQDVHKGVEFVGSVIKPFRTYATNRTISNAFSMIDEYNRGLDTKERFASRYNSYMGFLVHHNTYGIRWRTWLAIQDKKDIMNVNMKKITVINKNRLLEQEDDGILTAMWHNNDNYELHQNNNSEG